MSLIAEFASPKFKESIDVSVNLGVDPRKSDQVVRGSTTLPAGTGKDVARGGVRSGVNAEKAKAAGADIVGFDDLAESIQGGNSILMWLSRPPTPCVWSVNWAPCSDPEA